MVTFYMTCNVNFIWQLFHDNNIRQANLKLGQAQSKLVKYSLVELINVLRGSISSCVPNSSSLGWVVLTYVDRIPNYLTCQVSVWASGPLVLLKVKDLWLEKKRQPLPHLIALGWG